MHIWLRAEERPNERRTPLTPEGAAALIAAGFEVTVEESPDRCFQTEAYVAQGAQVAPFGSWRSAAQDIVILGLKELPEEETPLIHQHIMFGHAYKGQPAGRRLLDRFKAGSGTLLDLEYLVDEAGRRVAAFGYWAGYAGAAVALKCWAASERGGICGPVRGWDSSAAMLADLQAEMSGLFSRPSALVIGALGRVGTGASDLCTHMGVPVTGWDMAETASGGPFPEVLQNEIFLNCILARPGTPVFVPASAKTADRALRVIGDIACDPDSDFSPIKVYDQVTAWDAPALRVHETPVLDVTAIDNLPSLLPTESAEDFAGQLLPHLLTLTDDPNGIWARANDTFRAAV